MSSYISKKKKKHGNALEYYYGTNLKMRFNGYKQIYLNKNRDHFSNDSLDILICEEDTSYYKEEYLGINKKYLKFNQDYLGKK